MWIPNATDKGIGTTIHVTGSLKAGFEHEFKRNYRTDDTGRNVQVIPLGNVPADAISDFPLSDEITLDVSPIDRLEEEALVVPAPGPSMRSTSGTGPVR